MIPAAATKPLASTRDDIMTDNAAEKPSSAPGDPRNPGEVEMPPNSLAGTLTKIGPGLIIAGSIVGSGELIATTKTGAQAGIALLWLIIVGCIIKVFVQFELGRYSITHGRTTLAALNTLPGRIGPANWILWFWAVMMACTLAQLGGIVGGVGQALALSFPITGDYRDAIQVPSGDELRRFINWESAEADNSDIWKSLSDSERKRIRSGQQAMLERIEKLGSRGTTNLSAIRRLEQLQTTISEDSSETSQPEWMADSREGRQAQIEEYREILSDPFTTDDRIWATVAALLTMGLLYNGRYSLIQTVSTALVVSFTFITLGNVFALQSTPEWTIPVADWIRGFSFGFSENTGGKSSLATALATFGIIGVGATELIAYPYWCIERGYARYAGPRTDEDSWAARAKGWLRVMRTDILVSMLVYTIATVAFYVMGVAVLYRKGLDPDGMRMVSTLAESYVPVFGNYAKWLFLIGAVAVLYSTFLVALAAQTRIYTDALKVFGLLDPENTAGHNRSISIFAILLPLICLTLYWARINPVTAVLLSGTMQAIMLPMLGFAALYFRHKAIDSRLVPTKLHDWMLVLSFLGLLIAGCYGVYTKLF